MQCEVRDKNSIPGHASSSRILLRWYWPTTATPRSPRRTRGILLRKAARKATRVTVGRLLDDLAPEVVLIVTEHAAMSDPGSFNWLLQAMVGERR